MTAPIIDRIENSSFIVADITYLNANVIYEVGYAIGKQKRVFLIRHKLTIGDKSIANEVGIFDTLGYIEYKDTKDLCGLLESNIDQEAMHFINNLNRTAPVYVVEPRVKNWAATVMTSRLKKARYRYRSFIPTEDVRLSAMDAINNVASSLGVMVSLIDSSSDEGKIHNIRSMFVAGLAHGMEKPTLVLCPADFTPPLDVRDEVKRYQNQGDIHTRIHELSLEITEYSQKIDPTPINATSLLDSLCIGAPTAENEMATLASYYLKLDQYERAARGEVNLVVGRKGSGKTALFIQVRDKIRGNKSNVVVDLLPEGYQLIKLKEEILEYLTEGARQHLITAFWEYLLLLEVTHKILDKDRNIYKHNENLRILYEKLDESYRVEDFSSCGDFSERLLKLSNKIHDSYKTKFNIQPGQKLTSEEVSELVYGHDIRELRKQIAEYLERKQSVWILFDNLDKGWNTKGVEDIDAVILRCLIDAGRKLERDLRKAKIEFHCLIFIRNDVYEHLIQKSADFGKEMRVTLDWTDLDLLREMLRLRLVSCLGQTNKNMPFEQVWHSICVSHYNGQETSTYLIERTLWRPRNLLKIFSHCRGFANNFNRQKITEEDIEKGLLAYSHDLLIELGRELGDISPVAKDLLYHFIDINNTLSLSELKQIIKNTGVSEIEIDNIIDYLLYYGVIGIHLEDNDIYIYNVNYDSKILKIKIDRAGDLFQFIINPAFWPALGIKDSSH